MRLGPGVSILAICAALFACGGGSAKVPSDAGSPPPPDAGSDAGGDAGPPLGWTRLDAIAGQPGGAGWVDGPLAAAQFENPWAITGDGKGHLYVGDGQTIRAIDVAAGKLSTLAGAYQQMGGMDGVGASARFNSPQGVAFAGGAVYLTDTENHTIRAIDVATGAVTTVAGTLGMPGATDGTGPAARFQEPEGLAVDGAGNLYIGDTDNNTIRVMSLATKVVTTIAGQANTAGTTDGVGLAARFDKPRGLAIDAAAGKLYIADSFNQSVRQMVLATKAVTTIATFGTVVPQGLAVDQADVLVSLSDDTVVRIAGASAPVVAAGASNEAGFIDGTGVAARFDSPAGLLNDGAGTLYVVDGGNAVVRAMTLSSAKVSTFAGARSAGFDDGTGTAARFDAPTAIATDGVTAYVADTGNDEIRQVDLATGKTTTVAGSAGVIGDVDGTGAAASFYLLAGIAFNPVAKVVYVVDGMEHDVRRIDATTRAVTHLAFTYDAQGALFQPGGAALDRGHLYVTDFHTNLVRDIDIATMAMTTIGVTLDAGASGALAGPQGIAADGKGNLFVADAQSHTIRQIDLASGTMTVLAGQLFVQGEANGAGSEALFTYPSSVAADAMGNVYVTDLSNAVRRIDVATGVVTTAVGDLQLGGFLPGPLPARLTQPGALAVTPTGDLLLASENTIAIAH